MRPDRGILHAETSFGEGAIMFGGENFVVIHTAISLIGLVLGIAAVAGLYGKPVTPFVTNSFLFFALATSVTGFMFPFSGVTPAFATGIVATVILIPTIYARLYTQAAGSWRWIYAAGLVASEYLLAFVTVVQLFLKVPALAELAPGGAGPVFGAVQLVVLAAFIYLGWRAARTYKPTLVSA
jgi:hypothetical protein